MLDLLRLYLVNILRPVFEDPQLIQDDLLSGDVDRVEDQEDSRSQTLSFNDSDWNEAQSTRRKGTSPGTKASHAKFPGNKSKRRSIGDLGLLDSNGPKLIHGARSWLLLFQIIGQVNWLGVPLYLSLLYKVSLFAVILYVYIEHFLKFQINSNIIDSNYRNPIFIFIGLLAIVTTFLHAAVTIYSNLFNLCPLFKVLTTPKLCFIKREVQHIVGTKLLFFSLIFHIYQGILLQLLGMKDLNDFFNQFHIGRFVLDSFVIICSSYLFVGITQIDFYIRICFGFWIIAMKTNLEYRSAFLQRHYRLNRLASASAARHLAGHQPVSRAKRDFASAASPSKLARPTQVGEREPEAQLRVGDTNEPDTNEDSHSQNSLETTTTVNRPNAGYCIRHRPTTAEELTLSGFKEKYKLDTVDEIQKSLNTMDDHLEVCRGIQNGSLVLITLNAFLTNGAILLLAYNLLANQGKYFHGVIMVLLAFNNTLIVFLCYIGDSWISYALGSFVQTVEDEYFLQGGDDCNSVQPEPQQQRASGNGDAVLPLAWSIIRMNEPSDAGSETAQPVEILKRDDSVFLIQKKDVLFCREFLHQFENHLATPWSKLTVKIHLHMLGTFVTLIAAQIIFDREH